MPLLSLTNGATQFHGSVVCQLTSRLASAGSGQFADENDWGVNFHKNSRKKLGPMGYNKT